MDFIDLGSLTLNIFNKDNKDDLCFAKRLFNDASIKKWFSGMADVLKKNSNGYLLGHGFIVKEYDLYVGYIGIGNYSNSEQAVYLRAAIDGGLRGMGYGSRLLNEISEYIFLNFPMVKCIKLKIDKKNINSIKTATSCKYKPLRDDFYVRYNPYKNKCKTKKNEF